MIDARFATPESRYALIEAVGPDEYNRLWEKAHKASILATVGGRDIYPVNSSWGRLYAVGGTDKAFSTLNEAKAHAREVGLAELAENDIFGGNVYRPDPVRRARYQELDSRIARGESLTDAEWKELGELDANP